jgi:hypothetical protein
MSLLAPEFKPKINPDKMGSTSTTKLLKNKSFFFLTIKHPMISNANANLTPDPTSNIKTNVRNKRSIALYMFRLLIILLITVNKVVVN